MNNSKGTLSYRHNRICKHVNPQRLWQQAQDLHSFKPDKAPMLRKGHGHELPSLAKKQSPMNNHLQMKIYFSLIVSLGIQNTVTKRLHKQQYIDNKTEQATILADFLSYCLFCLGIYCFAFISLVSSGGGEVEAENKQTKSERSPSNTYRYRS